MPDKLQSIQDGLAARATAALLVIRHDHIVWEWYAPEWNAARKHYTASLAKLLVGGLSLLVALGDGRLGADDRVASLVPRWAAEPQKAQITIRQLATHSSGLEDAEQGDVPHDQLPAWKGRFWKRQPDPFTIARDEVPVVDPTGTRYRYSNPGMAMLSYAVTAALRGAPQSDVRSLVRERVYRPIGLQDDEWSIGYDTPYRVDGLTLYANWGGGAFTPRATARVGRLFLRRGNWQGTALLDPAWVARATTAAGTPLPDRRRDLAPAAGLCGYSNVDGIWPTVPRDAFAGAGAGHQVLLVVPSLDLIVVRNGQALADIRQEGFWSPIYRHIFEPVMDQLLS